MSRSFLIRFTTISAVYAYQDQQYSLSINYIGIRIYTSVIHRCIGVLFVYSKNRRRTRRTPTPTLAHPPLEHHLFGDLVMKIHVVNSKIRLSSVSFMFKQCEKKRDVYLPHSLVATELRRLQANLHLNYFIFLSACTPISPSTD